MSLILLRSTVESRSVMVRVLIGVFPFMTYAICVESTAVARRYASRSIE